MCYSLWQSLELVQPMADHQKAIDNLSQNLAKYDTLSIKQGLDG